MHRTRTLGRAALVTITALAALSSVLPASAAAWGSIHTVDDAGRADSPRSMVVQGARAWLTYVDENGVEVRRSTNGGATWGAEHVLEPRGSDYLSAPQLAVSGSHVLALYLRGRNAPADQRWLVRRSNDGGRTWHAHTTVATSDPAGPAPSMSIGMTGTDAVIGWTDSDTGAVRVRRSADGGATWASARTVGTTNIKVYWYEAAVQVVAAGGHVYVTWQPDRNGSGMATGIVMRRSDDGGASFHSRTWLTADALYYWGGTAIAASGDRLVAVYQRAGRQLAEARSSDAGTTMHTQDVTHSQTDGSYAIAIRGASARLAVTSTNGRVSLRTSSDGGANWSSAADVAAPGDDVVGVAVGTGTRGTAVVWEHDVDPVSGGTILSRHKG